MSNYSRPHRWFYHNKHVFWPISIIRNLFFIIFFEGQTQAIHHTVEVIFSLNIFLFSQQTPIPTFYPPPLAPALEVQKVQVQHKQKPWLHTRNKFSRKRKSLFNKYERSPHHCLAIVFKNRCKHTNNIIVSLVGRGNYHWLNTDHILWVSGRLVCVLWS